MYHIYLGILAVVDKESNLLFLKSIHLHDTSDCYQFKKLSELIMIESSYIDRTLIMFDALYPV